MFDFNPTEIQLAIPWPLIAAGAGQLISQYMQNRSAENISTDNERIALASLMRQDEMARKAFDISREQENFTRRKWWEQQERLHPYREAGMGALWAGQSSSTPAVMRTPEPEPVAWGEWPAFDKASYFDGGATPSGYSQGSTFNVYGGAGGQGYGGAGGQGYGGAGGTGMGGAGGAGGSGGGGRQDEYCPEGKYWNPKTRKCEEPTGGTDEDDEDGNCPDGQRPNPTTGECRGHVPRDKECDPATKPTCEGGREAECGDGGIWVCGTGGDGGLCPRPTVGRPAGCQNGYWDEDTCQWVGCGRGAGGDTDKSGDRTATGRGARAPVTMMGMVPGQRQRRSGYMADML